MTIPFSQLPAALRIPFDFFEVDNSKANLGTTNARSLLIGQKTTAGSATANVPVLVQGVAWAVDAFGAGSMLADMVRQYRARDPFGEVWALPVADNGSGTAATGSFKFDNAASAAGTLNLYIGGQRVQQPVVTTQSISDLATALAALINADTNLPVTAAVDGTTASKVNLTARHKGGDAGDIDLRVNYRASLGPGADEATPTGLTYTITAMSGGASNPTLTTALANLGDTVFDYIAMPFTDSTSLAALKSALADRWGPLSMLYGGAFAAYRSTVGGLTTFGNAQNDPALSVMGIYQAPEPTYRWAAEITAAAAQSLSIDPAVPLQDLALNVLPPPPQYRFSKTDRNTLLFDGIATYTVDAANQVRIERLVTTYQTNAQSQADDSWLDVERRYTIAYAIRSARTLVQGKFSRCKLADDGTRAASGSRVVTPADIKAALVGHYRTLELNGIVQDTEAFKRQLVVERNTANRGRVDVLWPIVPIDQLRQLGILAQFRNASSLGA